MADPILGRYVDEAGVQRPVKGVAVLSGVASDGSSLPPALENKGGTTTFTPDAATATSKVEVKILSGVTYTRTTTFSPSADALVTKVVGDWVKS